MITEFLLETVVGIVLGLVQMTPASTVDYSQLHDQSQQVGALASALNGYTPVAQVGAALVLLVALKLALLAWQGVMFIYHQFWGSS